MNKSVKTTKTRAQQKQETRQLILYTAKSLFLEKGYEETTMRAIAKTAGIAIGTTFTHFPDKPSLLAATLYEDMETVLKDAYESQPEDSSLLEMLVHPIRKIYTHFAKTPELSKTWVRETMFLKGYWGNMIDEQFERSADRIKQLLLTAQENGQLSREKECEALARGAISHYISTLIYGLKKELDPESQVDIYKTYVEQLLTP